MTRPNSLEVQCVALASLQPYKKGLRRHSRRKIDKLKNIIGHFGQLVPIIIDAENVIIDGHAVHQAMTELGAGEIKVIRIAGLSNAEIKALRLALNRLAEEAAWDSQTLKTEFEELVSLSFDLDLTGFDMPQIDHILDLDLPNANVLEEPDGVPTVSGHAVSTLNDIWICGRHRIGCGSALDQDFVAQVTDGVLADVLFIDPPYNVAIDGFVSGKGRHRHREFVQGTGEMSSAAFTQFLGAGLAVLKAAAAPRALIYVCMDWRHLGELLAAGAQCSLPLYNLAVWVKTNAGMGSLYRNQHELVAIFSCDGTAPVNNVELGRHGRTRSNVWQYRGMNAFGHGRELLAAHPTVKPVALVADVLRDVTRRGGVVLDTFLGSGTTLIAAEETGRRCFATELDPLYVDVAVRRWQACTSNDAVHASSGELFHAREEEVTAAAQSAEEAGHVKA